MRGSYIVEFYPSATVPQLSDVIASPPTGITDGDVVVVVDASDPVSPVIASQGVYTHPAPTITAINGPQGTHPGVQ